MGNHFKTMFSAVQDNVIKDIISGDLYKDNKTLSKRIWNYTKANEKDIQSIIAEGIAQKKSASELAKDLKEFVKPASKRSTDWGDAYPNLRSKEIDYNAMRLARTSINHAYQNASIQGSQDNPFVEGILWQSALQHRTCQLCLDRDGKVFSKDDVPLDHPNGLCTMIPYIPKDLKEIGKEIGAWVDGEDNEKLDNWLGMNFANNLINKAEVFEPKITNDLIKVSKTSGGELKGLEHKIKTQDSLHRKIMKDAQEKNVSIDEATKAIKDVLRYTVVYDDTKYTKGYFETVYELEKNGYNIVRVKNTFKDGEPYKGINTLIKDVNGYVFELQYHTPVSFQVKDGVLHRLFEGYRELDPASNEAVSIRDEMISISKSITNPKGVERVR